MRVLQRPVLPIACALLLLNTAAHAQGWHIDAQAGRLRFDGGPEDADFASLTLALGHERAGGGTAFAVAVPFGARDPFYGAASLWQRLPRIPRLLALDVAVRAFLYHERGQVEEGLLGPVREPAQTGYGIAAEVLPVLRARAGSAQAELRAGVRHYRSEFDDVVERRTLGSTDLRVSVSPLPSFALVAEARHERGAEDDFSYAGLTGHVRSGALDAWSSVGHWFGEEQTTVPWAAGISARVVSGIRLSLSARRHVLDPLYPAPPRTTWGIGASIRFGTPARLREPVPAAYANGQATIRLRGGDAPEAPRIAGDFTDWTPRPMTRAGRDWVYVAPLEPGVYHYAFVAPDGRWFVPESTPGRRDDGMGGHVAVLVVQEGA